MEIPVLSPAPRPLTVPVRLSLVLGQTLSVTGSLVLLFGSIFFTVFALQSEVRFLPWWGEKLERTEAVVTGISASSAEVNDQPVFEITYRLQGRQAGLPEQGTSWTDGPPAVKVGQAVAVDYAPAHPAYNVLTGARPALFPAWVGLVGLLPLAGVVLLGFGLRQGLAAIGLLTAALPATGKLVRTEGTNMTINDQPVIRYIYQFSAQGQSWEAKAETHTGRYADGGDQLVLYHPEQPARALVAASLPGGLTLTGSGNFSARPLRVLLYLVLTAGVVLDLFLIAALWRFA